MRILFLAVFVTACSVDMSVRRRDGSGPSARQRNTKIETGAMQAAFVSPEEMGRAYGDVVRADATETACAADPNSAGCVVGLAEDGHTARYALRRGYGRPFGGSRRAAFFAGTARLDDSLAAGPAVVPVARLESPADAEAEPVSNGSSAASRGTMSWHDQPRPPGHRRAEGNGDGARTRSRCPTRDYIASRVSEHLKVGRVRLARAVLRNGMRFCRRFKDGEAEVEFRRLEAQLAGISES